MLLSYNLAENFRVEAVGQVVNLRPIVNRPTAALAGGRRR